MTSFEDALEDHSDDTSFEDALQPGEEYSAGAQEEMIQQIIAKHTQEAIALIASGSSAG